MSIPDLFTGTPVPAPVPPGPCVRTAEALTVALSVVRCVPCGWSSPPASSLPVLDSLYDTHAATRRPSDHP